MASKSLQKKFESPQEVCEECLKKTKIEYTNKGGFFTSNLRSINHLEVGYSKIISNPVTIFLERLYVLFKRIRGFFLRLKKRLFPRRDKVYASTLDSYVTGKVVFAARTGPREPIINMKLEMWGRTRLFQWRKLAEGFTGSDGTFRLPFDLRATRNWRMRKKIRFEIHDIKSIRYGEEVKPRIRRKDRLKKEEFKRVCEEEEGPPKIPRLIYEPFHTIKFSKKDLIGMGYNLREIQLEYWAYRKFKDKDTRVPRAVVIAEDGDHIQGYTKEREDAFIQQVIPIEITKLKHFTQIKTEPETIDHFTIQADYPENLTTCIEKGLKDSGLPEGYTRGDDFFGERMMNGMNRGSFLPDPTDPGHFLIKYFGICNYDHNNDYALPDVIIKFKLNQKGLPLPVKITTIGALNAINKDKWQKREFSKNDGEDWLAAKRIARVNGAVCTEVDEHFTGTHLNTEQFSIAAFRNFRLNPLAILLLPHLKEVSIINTGADKLIIGGFLPRATALTEEGLIARTRDLLGMHDWKGWKPMEVISKTHHYAIAERMFWELTEKYVDTFFEQYHDGIIEHWEEVYLFSRDLVKNSVPVFLSDKKAMDALSDREKEQAKERFEYYKFQYGFNPDLPRETIDDELKAISPITKSRVYDPTSENLKNIKEACKYAIMMATFMHTWINEHQYDDLGEVMYNCGGLRFGTTEKGVLAPEKDLTIAPDLTRSTQQLWFANLLSRTEYGFITVNEDGDVSPVFRRLLCEKREEFAKIGVDIDDIESRTNI